MSAETVIAIDAMGGDNAPAAMIDGAAIAAMRFPGAKYIFFGDQPLVQSLLAKHAHLASRSVIRHTPDKISSDMKPSQALRQGRNSSMRLALDAVADGEAQCAVSAGNTGALMALAKFALKTLPNIDRPALAGTIPTTRGQSLMMDLGANIECDSENLVQFALMGAILARTVLGIQKPSVGILNVGSEEIKGHEEIRTALNILRERPFPAPHDLDRERGG
ncbi:MAG: phosphate acyltransferase, partial [Alphaproteobacteria bacterium]|nr:phosphate acyltransferase [Alphaproteobacteria bacterium]